MLWADSDRESACYNESVFIMFSPMSSFSTAVVFMLFIVIILLKIYYYVFLFITISFSILTIFRLPTTGFLLQQQKSCFDQMSSGYSFRWVLTCYQFLNRNKSMSIPLKILAMDSNPSTNYIWDNTLGVARP